MDAKAMDKTPARVANSNDIDIQIPESAHIRRESQESTILEETDSDSELEATELRQLSHDLTTTLQPISHILSPGKPMKHWYDPIKKYWRHQIRISVPHDDCRDHLANERTFLGYLRTSIALSMMGIVIAQLWSLEHSLDPSEVFGYFVLSKPLSVIFQSAALCMTIIGSIRYWRQQSAMAIGKVHAGGWEITTAGIGTFTILVLLFGVHVGVDIYDSAHPKGS